MVYLKKSIFRNFIEFAEINYGYKLNVYNIEKDLQDKLCDDSSKLNNKMAQKQLDTIILPAVTIYKSLTAKKYNEKEIISCIKEYVLQYYKKQARIISILGKMPFFYTIFKLFFPIAMKMYPDEFWNIEWLSRDNDKIEFNMRDCLYYKTFKKYDCSQLTHIFCEVDNLCYDNMSNKITFIRTKTLGKNDDVCDFRFERRK